ncbi:MAG: glycosyltransferase [Desulfobacterales bacterium]
MIRRKVLHIVEDLGIGGLERVVESIALGLDKKKYEVQVWCLSRGGAIAEALAKEGMMIKVLGMSSYHHPIQVLKLAKLLWLSKIDIVHTHGYFGGIFGRLAAIIARTPSIFAHVHTSYFGFKKRNIFVDKILSYFTNKIISVSGATKEFVCNFEGINAQKVCVIYNGADPKKSPKKKKAMDRNTFGFSKEDFVIVTVASLVKNKGHRVIINAIQRVLKKNSSIKLLIVGDGPLKNELEDFVIDSRLGSHIRFAGLREDVFPLLNLADLFILATIEREGLGVSIIEAMSAGLPVIGTSIGGIPELIENQINGLLVAPGDPYELAVAIERLASDKDQRRNLATQGKKKYEQKFTAVNMVKQIELLYEELEKAV